VRTGVLICVLSLGAATMSSAQTAASGSAGKTGGSTSAVTAESRPTSSDGWLPEPHILSAGVDFASQWLGGDDTVPRDGLYPDFDIVTGAGWISAGPGYRRHVWNGHALVDASAAMSWRAYKEAKARFELPALAHDHLTVGAQARWQDYTQVNYFGRGPDALHEQRSEYRLQDTDVLGYGIVRPHAGLSVSGRFGWLKQPTLSSPTGPFDRDYPNALVQFAGEPGVADPTSYLHGDVAVTADSRNYPGHPTRGGFYRAAAGFYSDRNLDRYSFRRYEAEGLQMLPVATEKWLVALHGWGVFSDTAAGNDVPFYLLPSLGGDRTLRGYDNFRFHDRNLLLASVESRWALFRQVDAALFAEAGNVAARAGDLNFDKTSYGAGVRVHTRTATIGRLDVGHSQEGWQVYVALNDPLRLTRRTERNTVVPIVP